MKHLLNTLFVTTQGAYLFKEGESVVVSVERVERLRVPVHNLGGIVCFGNVMCSPFLLGHCAENRVAVSFLTENGRFLARVQGGVSGNVLLRREQYRRADDPAASARLARGFVIGKVANARTVLQRAGRDHAEKDAVEPLDGAVEMDDETRKTVIVAWQKRKQEEIRHPFLDETVPVGLVPYVQSLLLARHLRGDLDGYPPFIWK